MMNKKGQQMTLGTIIAIVLGIAVLVFLIFGFSTGWSNMWDRIINIGGGGANVDSVVQGCEIACAQNSADAFCRESRTINYGDGKTDTGSCKAFLDEKDKVNANIKSCSSISCAGIDYDKLEQKGVETEEVTAAQKIVNAAKGKVDAAQRIVTAAGDAATDAQKKTLAEAKEELGVAEAAAAKS